MLHDILSVGFDDSMILHLSHHQANIGVAQARSKLSIETFHKWTDVELYDISK
jgi:hypothetical protein